MILRMVLKRLAFMEPSSMLTRQPGPITQAFIRADAVIAACDRQGGAKAVKPCGGVLAYETMAGAFRVHKDGVYRFRCQKCGDEDMNDGRPRTCVRPTLAAKETTP